MRGEGIGRYLPALIQLPASEGGDARLATVLRDTVASALDCSYSPSGNSSYTQGYGLACDKFVAICRDGLAFPKMSWRGVLLTDLSLYLEPNWQVARL